MTETSKKAYRLSDRDARFFTDLAIVVFITSHLVNHALGLVSIEAMEAYRNVHSAFSQSPSFRGREKVRLNSGWPGRTFSAPKMRIRRFGSNTQIQSLAALPAHAALSTCHSIEAQST